MSKSTNAYTAVSRQELPGWEDNKPFAAKLRRVSLLTMAAAGAIPNELLSAAQRLFGEGFSDSIPLDKLGTLLRAIAAEALVEPTMQQLEDSGLELTDVQLAAIYNYTQLGARALLPFRADANAARSAGDEQAVQ